MSARGVKGKRNRGRGALTSGAGRSASQGERGEGVRRASGLGRGSGSWADGVEVRLTGQLG